MQHLRERTFKLPTTARLTGRRRDETQLHDSETNVQVERAIILKLHSF